MMDIAIFGSLYLDGVSVPHSPCPEYQKDQKIELGDGQPGAMLPWLCVGKKLIAAESLLCNVSWSQLQKAGFISGCTGTAPIRGSVVKMSGMEFMCHIPNIHKEPSEPIAGMRDARLWESRPNEDETDLLIARAEAGAESRPTKDGMFWTQVIGNPTMRGRDLGGSVTRSMRPCSVVITGPMVILPGCQCWSPSICQIQRSMWGRI